MLASLAGLAGQAPRAGAQGATGGDSAAAPVQRGVGTLLDGPVSRTAYRLGPGDVLDVGLLGDLNRVFPVSVAPEGTVLLPSIGVTSVLGLNIDQAERQIRTLVLQFYRNVDVKVSLSQVRSFKVFLVGNVPNPGVRPANAATRVSEILPEVGAQGIRHRNIFLRRTGGDTVKVDLVRFTQTGDLSANPTLREGDRLVVPTVDEVVQLFGRVYFPGAYEYVRGETLASLLSIANGAGDFPSDAGDTVRVARFVGPERRDLRLFSRADATGSVGQRFVLQPFDAVYISTVANYKQQKSAEVTGQVLRPGTYPIRPETTTVRELVAMAGGFTSDASVADAQLRRRPRATTDGQSVRQLQGIPAELLTSEERRVLETRRQGDPTLVVIDFQSLFADGKDAQDQPLETGDVLTIPVRRTGVTVLGAVVNPGIVPYAPNASLDHYVRLAGGYSRKADRRNRVVLRARLGDRVDSRDARDIRTVDAGDQIVVPFRERRNLLGTVQGVVTTATGFILSIYGLRQLLR